MGIDKRDNISYNQIIIKISYNFDTELLNEFNISSEYPNIFWADKIFGDNEALIRTFSADYVSGGSASARYSDYHQAICIGD